MPKLIIKYEGAPEETHDLAADKISIGFRKTNDIRIGDVSVSGHHAELTKSGDGYTYRDLGSTNGSFLDGKPIVEHRLGDGDIVVVATVSCLYREDAESEVPDSPTEAKVDEPAAAAPPEHENKTGTEAESPYPKPPIALPKSPAGR